MQVNNFLFDKRRSKRIAKGSGQENSLKALLKSSVFKWVLKVSYDWLNLVLKEILFHKTGAQ